MTLLVSAEAVVTSAGRIGGAVLVDGGSVVAVGERSDLVHAGVREERYTGAFIIPGLRDAHIHVLPYASLLAGCSLKRASSIEDLVGKLRAHAATTPPGEPVVATRFDDEHLSERRLPIRTDLDRAVPDRPAVIYRYCGHIAVANTAALSISGISATTSDPEGGSIDRDADGAPTGVLRETAAGLIAPALARGGPLPAHVVESALRRLASIGITSVGAMIGYGEAPSQKLEAEVDVLCAMAADRVLPIKVHGIVITDDDHALTSAARALSHAGPRLDWLGVKRFADGSLGGHTAAMRAPFADDPSRGTLRLTDADEAIARRSLDLGGMVAVHAVGDRAVSGVLDLFARLAADGADPSALRMEHASVIDEGLIARCAAVGATVVVQPAFLSSESDWLIGRVGVDRNAWLYPFLSMRSAGIPLAGSSDCPVEPPHPLWGMAAAMDRHGTSPHESLGGLDALDLFTDGAAAALREPPPMVIGSPADLVVIDTDLRTDDPEALRAATVIDTFVEGVVVDVDRSLPTWVD